MPLLASCPLSALRQLLHLTSPLSRYELATRLGCTLAGARDRRSPDTRSNCDFVTIPGKASSTRTGGALSFAEEPQTSVPL